MKKQYLRVRIVLMTFALGLASVNFFNWATDYCGEIPVDLPKAESASVLEIVTKHNGARFEIVGSACGGTNEYGGSSSVIGYRTNDWQSLSKSGSGQYSSKESELELEARIKDAINVLEDNKFLDDQSNIQKRRVVLENQNSRGQRRINILSYKGGKSISIIEAKSLQLALELEQALEGEQK